MKGIRAQFWSHGQKILGCACTNVPVTWPLAKLWLKMKARKRSIWQFVRQINTFFHRLVGIASKGFSHLPTNWLLAREDIWRNQAREGSELTLSSAEKWINICLCDEILRLWPLTPQLIWFQQQSTSLKLLSNQKWMALKACLGL